MQPNPPETADLVTFTEEILYGKLQHLLTWRKPVTLDIRAPSRIYGTGPQFLFFILPGNMINHGFQF